MHTILMILYTVYICIYCIVCNAHHQAIHHFVCIGTQLLLHFGNFWLQPTLTHRHTWLLARCRNDLTYMNGEWVGIQGYLKFKKDLSGTQDFATVILATLMIFDPFRPASKLVRSHITHTVSHSSRRPRCKVTNQSAYQPMGHCGNLMSWLKFKMIYSTDVGDIFVWW